MCVAGWICCSWIFFQKDSCVVWNLLYRVSIHPLWLCWCWWYIIKQIFHAIFCLISTLFTLHPQKDNTEPCFNTQPLGKGGVVWQTRKDCFVWGYYTRLIICFHFWYTRFFRMPVFNESEAVSNGPFLIFL